MKTNGVCACDHSESEHLYDEADPQDDRPCIHEDAAGKCNCCDYEEVIRVEHK